MKDLERHEMWPFVPSETERRGFLVLVTVAGMGLCWGLLAETLQRPAVIEFSSPENSYPRINEASAGRLEEIPGIGLKRAKRIVEFRRRHGPIRKMQDVRRVKGVGSETVELLRQYTVTPSCDMH